MGLKAAVQALKKAEELKARVSRHNDLLNNSEVWSDQQQLQTVYHQVLVLDLEYALDKKVEQELWTLGFKNHIAALQHLSRDKKNPRRSEYQALLSWCLEAASGFYLTLLQELCSTFELDLPFRRRSAIYGQTKPWPNSEQLMQPHRTSCLYICQYCLVHLGDIARYRSQRKQAESFYRHAILLSPSSGQPYNQLALLEASRGDKLATVFHYVRSISVKYPFPAAATNLSNTFSALIDNEEPHTEVHSKISQTDFILIFLKAHGLLHSVVDLNQAELYVKILNATFTALVATQVFSAAKLIQMTTINMYALTHTTDSLSTNQLSKDEIRVKHLVLELLAGALSAYLLPIYTINDNSILQDYYALPAIKLTLDWIKNNPTVLSDIVFIKRLQLWPSLCKLLNTLQDHIGDLNINKYNKIPLPEDRDLQCFLPLLNSFKDLDFTSDNLSQEVAVYNKLRISRLVSLGEWLCTQSVNNSVLMTSRKVPNTKTIWFEPEKKQPDPTTELLEELKFFNIHENQLIPPKEVTLQSYKVSSKGIEKRGGILKPQGSLEKSREEREQALLLTSLENDNSSCNTSLSNNSTGSVRSDSSKSKRTRQNIAMQALAKKVEENNKQVTFQTEPIIKTIDKLKTHETNKLISDIPKEMIKPPGSSFQPTNAAVNNSCSNIISNELAPNHCFQSPNNPVKVPIPCNQNISQNINQSLNQNITQSFQRPNISMGNIPFTVQQYSNTSSNLLYPNNIQQPSNMQYSRQQNINVPASNTLNQKNSNLPYNIGFERNTSTQPVGYQTSSFQMAPKEPFSSWTLDEKLPLPPSTWWSNNQKNLPLRSYASGEQETFKPPLSYNMNSINNSNMSFVQESLKPNNMDFNMQYNTNTAGTTSGYSNVSLWNSAANIHSNIQMLLNQSGPPLIQSTESNQISSCTNVNKAQSVIRDTNNTQGFRELHTNNQTNSMPGYSLFNSNWSPNLVHSALHNSASDRPLMRQQSLFSGPGPSPLERLLEQQKQMRGGNKEDS